MGRGDASVLCVSQDEAALGMAKEAEVQLRTWVSRQALRLRVWALESPG